MSGLTRGSKEWLEAMNNHYYQDPDVMYLLGIVEGFKDKEQLNGRSQEGGIGNRSEGIDDEFTTGG